MTTATSSNLRMRKRFRREEAYISEDRREGRSTCLIRCQIAGNILEVDEANSSAFNRDLNNLTVNHDPCQYVSYDPFLNPDDISRPTIFRTNDPGVNLQDSRALENERNQRMKTSRLSRFFLLFERKRPDFNLLSRGHRIWKENFSDDVVLLCKLFNSCCIFPLHPGL